MQQNTTKFIAPSGYYYVICAQNGEHDAMLSNVVDQATGANYDKFLCSIVQETDATESGKVTLDNIDLIPTLDYSYVILYSRMFSIGDEVRFSYNWGKKVISYSENLKPYLPDYTKPLLTPLDEGYFPYACPKYPNGKQMVMELSTSSGKKLKYNILNRGGEKKLLEIPRESHSINTGFIIRGLEQEISGTWYKASSFTNFTPMDMRELRSHLTKNDPEFGAYSAIENPETKERTLVKLLDSPDFFFPAEI